MRRTNTLGEQRDSIPAPLPPLNNLDERPIPLDADHRLDTRRRGLRYHPGCFDCVHRPQYPGPADADLADETGVFKCSFEAVATAFAYIVFSALKKAEGLDVYNRDTDLNPVAVWE